MTVHFIGAGPGARRPHHRARPRPDRALPGLPLRRLAGAEGAARPLPARRADRRHRADVARRDRGGVSSPRTTAGHDVARLHSGDLSVCSALAEQLRRLDGAALPTRVTPGVPAFAAAAAALGRELTLPELAQSVVLTRMPGRASSDAVGRERSPLSPRPARRWPSIWRSSRSTRSSTELTPLYGADCPVAVVCRASWPDERVVRGTLGTIMRPGRRRADRAHGARSWSAARWRRMISATARCTIQTTAAVSGARDKALPEYSTTTRARGPSLDTSGWPAPAPAIRAC